MYNIAEAKSMAMTEDHRKILRSKTVTIVQNLVFSEEFVSVLMRDGILTPEEKEKIEAQQTRSDKSRYLVIDTLPRRSDAAYFVFIEALVESRQDSLAEEIDSSLAAKFIEIRDKNDEEIQLQRPVNVSEASVDFVWKPYDLDESKTWYRKLFESETKDLGIELCKMTPDRERNIKEMMFKRKAYHLICHTDGFFGRAVIISNQYYVNMNPRPGSEVDCENLVNLFKQLHFKTVVHENLSGKEIKKFLEEERNNEEHQQYSLFVLCILAHGGNNKVYGIDGKVEEGNDGVVDVSDITSWFSGVQCPGPAGKPKLFFIQACQGGKVMLSVSPKQRNSDGPSSTAVASDAVRNAVTLHADGNPVFKDSLPLNVPEAADVLVAYSTAPGYKSWRHPGYGSWFIRCLIYVIRNSAYEDHVFDMLTEVAHIISHFKVKNGKIYIVQVPQVVSTLTKKVFFMP